MNVEENLLEHERVWRTAAFAPERLLLPAKKFPQYSFIDVFAALHFNFFRHYSAPSLAVVVYDSSIVESKSLLEPAVDVYIPLTGRIWWVNRYVNLVSLWVWREAVAVS